MQYTASLLTDRRMKTSDIVINTIKFKIAEWSTPFRARRSALRAVTKISEQRLLTVKTGSYSQKEVDDRKKYS